MSQTIPMLRLTPQAAGSLHQQHTKATQELRALARYNKELDHQLKALIGHDALRQLYKATANALLLADLVREAA